MPLNTRICESADVTKISDGFPGANYTTNATFLLDNGTTDELMECLLELVSEKESDITNCNEHTWNPVIFLACDLRFFVMLMSICASWLSLQSDMETNCLSEVQHNPRLNESEFCTHLLSCRIGSFPCATQ